MLVALADHGFTPTAIAARLTYLSRARLAAGRAGRRAARRRLALPRRHRGLRRLPARRRSSGTTASCPPTTPAGTRSRWTPYARQREAGRFVPGLGHPVHKDGDPRTPRLIADRRRRRACAARTCGCSRRSAGCTRRCSAARCRSTAPGSAAPRWPTSACRWSCCAASRCSPAPPGLLGQLAEELRRPSAWTSTCPSTATPCTSTPRPDDRAPRGSTPWPTVAAVIASTHHPFYYRASTATGADRPPFADEWVAKIEAFRETLTRARARRAGHGRQRPLPPAVAGQHAAVPRRQGAVLRRQLLQRGARVRPAADAAARARGPVRAPAARRPRRRTSTWRSATSCGSTTASPARSSRCGRRPTCRSCRSTPTSSRRRCRSRSGSSSWAGRSARLVESWPSDQRVAIIGTGHLSLELGGPRQFGDARPRPGVRPQGRRVDRQRRPRGLPGRGQPGQPAPARATPPTASWTSC